MNFYKLEMLPKLLCLSLLSLAISNCGHVTIQNGKTCSVAGKILAGGICSRLTSADTNDLTFKELVDFLEAQPARACVPVPDFNVCKEDQSQGALVTLPARGAAICMPSEDWGAMKVELDVLCRQAGSKCSEQLRAMIKRLP